MAFQRGVECDPRSGQNKVSRFLGGEPAGRVIATSNQMSLSPELVTEAAGLSPELGDNNV